MRLSTLYKLAIFLLVPCYLKAQCSLLSPVYIPPESNQTVSIEVNGLVNSDLGGNQSICAIYLELEHGRLENLRINLTSPAGQSVTLVGPGTTAGAFTSLINWNVSFVPCIVLSSPDPGINSTWSNGEPWSAFTNYKGSYYPHGGCLEDYNSGNANGEWSIEIQNLGTNDGNLIYFEILFCDPTGIQCDFCNPTPGTFELDYLIVCKGDPAFNAFAPSFSVDPVVARSQFESLVLIDRAASVQYSDDFIRLDTLEVGLYEICSLVADTSLRTEIYNTDEMNALTDLLDTASCAVIGPQCMTIEVKSLFIETFYNGSICLGDSLEFQGTTFYVETDTLLYLGQFGAEFCSHATSVKITLLDYEVELATVPDPVFCGQDIVLSTNQISFPGQTTEYNWFKGDDLIPNAGPLLSITEAGEYSVDVVVGSCIVSDTLELTDNNSFTNLIDIADRSCASDSFAISTEVIVGPQSIDPAITSLEGPFGPLPLPLSAENFKLWEQGEYYVTTMLGDCISIDTFVIQDDLMGWNLSASVIDTIGCDAQPVLLIIDTDAINPTLEFSGPENIPPNTVSPEVSTPGRYLITVTDDNMCSDTVSVVVFATSDSPTINVTDIVQSCSSQQAITLTADVIGVTDSLVWTGPDGASYYGLDTEVTEEGSYQLIAYGQGGCNGMATLNYSIENEPGFVGSIELNLFCQEDTLTLENNLMLIADNILWSDAQGIELATTDELVVTDVGTYSLLVTDSDGCTALQEYIVSFGDPRYDLTSIGMRQIEMTCDDTQEVEFVGDLSILGAIRYKGESLPIARNLELETGEQHFFIFEDLNGCTREVSIVITGSLPPALDLGPDITLNEGDSYPIPGRTDATSTQGWSFNWSDDSLLSCIDCLTPVVSPENSQWLALTIMDENGCEAMDSLYITILADSLVVSDSLGIYIPNIFNLAATPPDNKLTIGIDSSLYSSYELYLYDRWGNLVVQKQGPIDTNLIEFWDGKSQGKDLNIGVYVYMAKFLHMTGEEVYLIDQITLLK